MASDNSPEEAATPYTATTSDGEPRPVRKVKAPSDSFRKPAPPSAEMPAVKVAEEAPPVVVEEEESTDALIEELMGPAPSHEEASLAGPAPEPDPDPPTPQVVEVSPERMAAELRELEELVALESLKFLQPRVNKAKAEGCDALTLVAVYRLAARSLKDEADHARMSSDQYKREFEKARGRAAKMEVEFAGAVENAKASASASLDTEETTARVRQLELQLEQAAEQREKLQLDFRNMRDRVQKDTDFKVFKEKEKFFNEFLPVLDGFDQAHRSMNESSSAESLLQGLRMLYGLLIDAVEAAGLEKVNTGGSFDPRFHEAVGEVETQEKADEHVYDELQRGYRLGERLIRAAMVRIARNPSGIVLGQTPPSEEPPTGEEEPVAEESTPNEGGETTQE